ncbi:MAG: hypothetical protein IKI58_12780 [Oscillospiraceae bacterium]|nr:hypothetical protein [Oscillospiraceae bacterium]
MRTVPRLAAALCASALVLFGGSAVSAQTATVEDVFRAMRDVGTTEAMICDARAQYETSVHDENGMEMGGTYRTYGEWVTLIHENGVKYVVSVIAEEFLIDPQDIIDYYEIALPAEPGSGLEQPGFQPSVQPEKPFSEMTLEEKKAYIAQLPYEERVAFLATLSPADRKSICQQLDSGQKTDIAKGMTDFGREIGLHVTVDDIGKDTVQVTVHDREGNLIDKTSLGLSIDATGWNLTYAVLAAAAAVLLSAAGIVLLALTGGKEKAGKENREDA